MVRSSPPEVFLGKGALKICCQFTGEHPSRSVISIKLLSKFTEIALRYGFSPVNWLHIFRIPFPQKTSGRLLLFVKLVRVSQNFSIVPMDFLLTFTLQKKSFKQTKRTIHKNSFVYLFSDQRIKSLSRLQQTSLMILNFQRYYSDHRGKYFQKRSLIKRDAVARKCSVKKVFLEISQNLQENSCARVSFFNKAAGL